MGTCGSINLDQISVFFRNLEGLTKITSGPDFPVDNLTPGCIHLKTNEDGGLGVGYMLMGDIVTWIPFAYQTSFATVPNDVDITKFDGRTMVIETGAARDEYVYNANANKWLSSATYEIQVARNDGTINGGDILRPHGLPGLNNLFETPWSTTATLTEAWANWRAPVFVPAQTIQLGVEGNTGATLTTFLITPSAVNGLGGSNLAIDTDVDDPAGMARVRVVSVPAQINDFVAKLAFKKRLDLL